PGTEVADEARPTVAKMHGGRHFINAFGKPDDSTLAGIDAALYGLGVIMHAIADAAEVRGENIVAHTHSLVWSATLAPGRCTPHPLADDIAALLDRGSLTTIARGATCRGLPLVARSTGNILQSFARARRSIASFASNPGSAEQDTFVGGGCHE